MDIVDIKSFVSGPILQEKEFLRAIDAHDWGAYRGRQTLIRGCSDIIIPTWAYMLVAAKLATIARVVRFGNEHSNLVIHRASKQTEELGVEAALDGDNDG